MSVMHKIQSGDVEGISSLSYEEILADVRKIIPNIDSKGTFVVYLSGLDDDSREGIDCEVTLEIKDGAVFDVNAEYFQGETFEHTSISDGIKSLCKLIEGKGLHGDPYKTISCSISKFNNIATDDEIKKLAKFIIEQERSGDEYNIVAKLSIVYTVVSYEFSELKDKVDEIYYGAFGYF